MSVLRTADPLARRRRRTELWLLVLATATALTAYLLLGLAHDGQVPAGLAGYGAGFAALALIAHLAMRISAPRADPLLLPLAVMLNGVGLVVVRRIDFALTAARDTPPPPLAPAQLVWSGVAIIAFCATLVAVRDHELIDRYRYLLGLVSVVLLLLPLLPIIGVEVNGARLWLRLAGFSFQPGELAKLGIVAFFASYLADKRALLSVATTRIGPFKLPPLRALMPVVLAWLVSLAVLVLERDLGLSLLFFGVFVGMLYLATGRAAYLAIGTALFTSGALVAWTLFSHVQTRMAIWLDVWGRPEGFQLAQSLYALGTGGVTGVGLGQGRPDFIPFVQTDFVFAAVGEEFGLLGTTALLLCFLLMVARGFHVALECHDDVGTLFAAGLTLIFGLQVFVIIGGVTRVIPLTGLTLPFVSYGGSSLVANYMLVALLARVSAGPRPRRVDTVAADDRAAPPLLEGAA